MGDSAQDPEVLTIQVDKLSWLGDFILKDFSYIKHEPCGMAVKVGSSWWDPNEAAWVHSNANMMDAIFCAAGHLLECSAQLEVDHAVRGDPEQRTGMPDAVRGSGESSG